MDFTQIPDGNGQAIYIELEELFINPEFVNTELHAIVLPNRPADKTNPVYEAYKELFSVLFTKGYKIITDERMADDNTFYFTPCCDRKINKTKEEYDLKKAQKVKECLRENGIVEPLTIKFPADSFPTDLPELPLILKNEETHGGQEKFIISTEEQLQRLKDFYQYSYTGYIEDRKREIREKLNYMGQNIEVDDRGHTNVGWTYPIIDYKKMFHKTMLIQKYINTPTEYNTSLRILFSSLGDVIVASLKYSKPTYASQNEKFYGLFDKHLSDPKSRFYLGSKSVVSNTVAGGSSILLGKERYTLEEQRILIAHGVNPLAPQVPSEIINACKRLANNCSRELGALCGMDFIYDVDEKRWKYLEEHEYPMLYSYCEKQGITYDEKARDFYYLQQLVDIQIRIDVLVQTMKKKKENNMTETPIRKS